MLNLTKPRYFIPIHGEFRMLVQHGRLAVECGVEPENIFIIENGQPIEFLSDGSARRGEPVAAGYVFVDGLSVGEVGDVVLRDRRALANDGMFLVVVTVDKQTGIARRAARDRDPRLRRRRRRAASSRRAVERVLAALDTPGDHTSEIGLLKVQIKDSLSQLPVRADEAPADGLPGRGRGLSQVAQAASRRRAPEPRRREHARRARRPSRRARCARSSASSSWSPAPSRSSRSSCRAEGSSTATSTTSSGRPSARVPGCWASCSSWPASSSSARRRRDRRGRSARPGGIIVFLGGAGLMSHRLGRGRQARRSWPEPAAGSARPSRACWRRSSVEPGAFVVLMGMSSSACCCSSTSRVRDVVSPVTSGGRGHRRRHGAARSSATDAAPGQGARRAAPRQSRPAIAALRPPRPPARGPSRTCRRPSRARLPSARPSGPGAAPRPGRRPRRRSAAARGRRRQRARTGVGAARSRRAGRRAPGGRGHAGPRRPGLGPARRPSSSSPPARRPARARSSTTSATSGSSRRSCAASRSRPRSRARTAGRS